MAKRKRILNEKEIKRRIKEGRCQGDGKDYIPWIRIPDIASRGTSLKTFSEKTKRQHHTLSRLETKYFFTVEWPDNITDIKEQYAILDLNETVEIANQLGVKHPTDPRSGSLSPITTDFLLEIEKDSKKELVARTIKYLKDLEKARVLQKFDIERVYWQRRNVDWGIVTEEMIDQTLVDNIVWVRKAKTLDGINGLDINKVIHIEKALRNEIVEDNRGISSIASKITKELSLIAGTGLFVVRFLISNKIWCVDMHKPINPYTKIELLNVNITRLYEMRGI